MYTNKQPFGECRPGVFPCLMEESCSVSTQLRPSEVRTSTVQAGNYLDDS